MTLGNGSGTALAADAATAADAQCGYTLRNRYTALIYVIFSCLILSCNVINSL